MLAAAPGATVIGAHHALLEARVDQAAIAFVLFVVILIATLVQFRLQRDRA